MKKHLFARCLRAGGRLLLLVGAVFGFGMIVVSIYSLIYHAQHPESVTEKAIVPIQAPAVTPAEEGNPTTAIITTIVAVALALALIIVIARMYNNSMRRFIVKFAKFLKIQIISAELLCTFITWTVATILLIFTFPILSIFSLFAFIINELLFVFAWGAYGQPNYKI
ncbi:hypothetical protein IK110_01320 [Candidatus Saccharibacteria bacterium]|nr:hypothetical protein [Candidatus Saccharibacteria bacterium]